MRQIRLGSGQVVTVAHTGLIQHVITIQHQDGVFQLPPVIVGGLAGELAGMLEPEFPDCELSICRTTRQIYDFPAAASDSDRVSDLVVRLRGKHRPGREFLRLIGGLGVDAELLPQAKLRA